MPHFILFATMTKNAKAINIRNCRFWLLPEKAIYWQKKKMLMIADLHIGKSGHFRKHGIPVPGDINSSNIDKMNRLVQKVEPEHLIILGDLFHSRANKEWEQFQAWRKKQPKLEVSLVIGNHDILPSSIYHSSRINLFKKLTVGPFLLIHDLNQLPSNKDTSEGYVLSGHIHPAVRLRGKGRQSMKLPCFYFGSNEGILPAFGHFTGTHVIEPRKGEKVYTIADSRILDMNTN